MTVATTKRNGQGVFSLFKPKEEWLEIVGYHVGDIQTDKPVSILKGATVVGNVFTPEIIVGGLLYGSAVARQATIQQDGQVWSDIYAISLHIETGGKIQGWVSTLDEDSYLLLQGSQDLTETADIVALDDATTVMPEDAGQLTRDQADIDTLRLLQTEAATALAARSELESTFDKRLHEIAGETSAKVVSLDKELNATRQQVDLLKQDFDQVNEELRSREHQVEQLNTELTITRDTLNERNAQLETLTTEHTQLNEVHQHLQQSKTEIDALLQKTQEEVDHFKERTTNLETALQSSLQHSAEQEDSLIRWQELAETTQSKLDEVERDLSTATFKLEESSRVADMLRGQRQQTEQEWEKATAELSEAQERIEKLEDKLATAVAKQEEATAQLTENEAEIGPLREQLAQATAARDEAQAQIAEQTPLLEDLRRRYEEAETKWHAYEEKWQKAQGELDILQERRTEQLSLQTEKIMVETTSQMEQLKADFAATEEAWSQKLKQADNSLQEQTEQLLWYKVNLQSTKDELVQAREQADQQAEQLAVTQQELDELLAILQKLQTDVQAKDNLIERCKVELNNRANTITDQKKRLVTVQNELKTVKEQTKELKQTKESLRKSKLQLAATESELDRYLQEAHAQGQHLAEIQATLIEREIELKQLKATAVKQSAFIKQMKQVTTERIQKLERQLKERS